MPYECAQTESHLLVSEDPYACLNNNAFEYSVHSIPRFKTFDDDLRISKLQCISRKLRV